MAYVARKQPAAIPKQTVSLVFGDVRGVDFRSDDTMQNRTPDSVNMYRSRLGLWETHPGFRKIGYVGKSVPIWGMHKYTYRDKYGDVKTKVLVHAGTRMYTWDNYPNEFEPNTLTELFNGMANKRTKFCEFQNVLLILDGEALYYYDGNVMDYVSHKGYVPKIYTGNSPDAKSGSTLNQRNFLSRWVIEGYAPDNTAVDYTLHLKDLDADTLDIWIMHEGKEYHYTEVPATSLPSETEVSAWDNTFYKVFSVDRENGTVKFKTAPQYEIAGVENVFIKYAKGTAGYEDRINKCTEMIVFDNRLFVTGHPGYPNYVYWSGNGDWTYFSEVYYSDKAGASAAPIMGLQLLQESKFLSIKADTHQDGAYTVWSQSNINDETLGETYLTSSGNSTIGCVSGFAHCVFIDDNVFLSSNGLNAVSRNLSVSMERNVEHRSTLVDPKLLAENLEDAIVEQHRGYLYILFPNGHCYMANASTKTDNVSNNIEYEWAYLEGIRLSSSDGSVKATQLASFNDKELYLCSSDGHLCKFYFDYEGSDGSFPSWTYNFDGKAINEYVDTPFSWFGVQNRFKKLVRKYNDLYCEVRAHTDIEVLFHTEKNFLSDSKVLSFKADVFTFNDIEFNEDFTFKTLPPASFVLKKLKGKRFRRLQLRIKGATINKPVIFKSLVVDAYVLTRKLK